MTKTTAFLLILVCTLMAHAEDGLLTRDQLFSPIEASDLSHERRYAELDLNGDGTNDLLLSESVSLGGTGGLIYNLYLGAESGQFLKIDRFIAGIMAIEIHGGISRLWSYSHMSAVSGTLQYRYFDRNDEFKSSQPLTIYPGDGGSEIGNAVYQSIFNDKTILKMTKTHPVKSSSPVTDRTNRL